MATSVSSDTQTWQELARQLRVDSIRCDDRRAGSGHPTSSHVRRRPDGGADRQVPALRLGRPARPHNDHLIFSKGHASPLLYALFKAAGAITDEELMTLASSGAGWRATPTRRLPWVDVATGSLGQGLPIGVGIALAGKYLDKLPYRVWVLLGDSEMAEGSIWEALDKAASLRARQPRRHPRHEPARPARRDRARLGHRAPTRRGPAFGWHAHRDRRPRPGRDRRGLRRGDRHDRTADARGRADDQGQGRRASRTRTAGTAKPLPPDVAKAALAALGRAISR